MCLRFTLTKMQIAIARHHAFMVMVMRMLMVMVMRMLMVMMMWLIMRVFVLMGVVMRVRMFTTLIPVVLFPNVIMHMVVNIAIVVVVMMNHYGLR